MFTPNTNNRVPRSLLLVGIVSCFLISSINFASLAQDWEVSLRTSGCFKQLVSMSSFRKFLLKLNFPICVVRSPFRDFVSICVLVWCTDLMYGWRELKSLPKVAHCLHQVEQLSNLLRRYPRPLPVASGVNVALEIQHSDLFQFNMSSLGIP